MRIGRVLFIIYWASQADAVGLGFGDCCDPRICLKRHLSCVHLNPAVSLAMVLGAEECLFGNCWSIALLSLQALSLTTNNQASTTPSPHFSSN